MKKNIDAESSGATVREKILAEFALLLSQQGYAKTSMRQLSERCGMSSGHINFYFRKKEDLTFALFRDFSARTHSIMKDHFQLPGNAATQFFLHHLILYYSLTQIPMLSMVMADMAGSADYMTGRSETTYRVLLRVLETRGIAFSPAEVEIGCLCATHSVFAVLRFWYCKQQAFDYQKLFSVFCDILISQGNLEPLAACANEALQLFLPADHAKLLKDYEKPCSATGSRPKRGSHFAQGSPEWALSGLWLPEQGEKTT